MEDRIAALQQNPRSMFNDSPFKQVDKEGKKEAMREKVVEESFANLDK